MRIVVLICVLVAVAGCADTEIAKPKIIVKTVTKVVEVPAQPSDPKIKFVYVDKCPPPKELSAHCNAITTRKDCDAEQRCQWAEGEKVSGYCRRIYCKQRGKEYTP